MIGQEFVENRLKPNSNDKESQPGETQRQKVTPLSPTRRKATVSRLSSRTLILPTHSIIDLSHLLQNQNPPDRISPSFPKYPYLSLHRYSPQVNSNAIITKLTYHNYLYRIDHFRGPPNTNNPQHVCHSSNPYT